MGLIQPSLELEDNDDLTICPVLTNTQNKQFTVFNKNFLEHPYTLKKRCYIATFSLVTPKQPKIIKSVDPAPSLHLLDTKYDYAIQ